PIIRAPTTMSAGAVAKGASATRPTSGVKNSDRRKSAATTKAVRPVRPPAATPLVDSTYVVPLGVPKTEPPKVPMASANSPSRDPAHARRQDRPQGEAGGRAHGAPTGGAARRGAAGGLHVRGHRGRAADGTAPGADGVGHKRLPRPGQAPVLVREAGAGRDA